MLKDLENRLNILQEESNLIVDFCSVIESFGKTCTVESSTKFGRYENTIVLGNYTPKKGDTGVVMFAGKYKYPYFIPKFRMNMLPGSTGINVNNAITGEIKDFINFIDELDKNPEYKNYFDISAPKENMWGVPIFIQILFQVGKLFYYKYNRKIRIGDIARAQGGIFGPHKGIGHASGRGCDLNDIYDDITQVKDETSYQRAKDILNIFKSAGIKTVIWDIQYSSLTDRFRQDFGEFIRTTQGNHITHWHVSVIEPGQSQ